MDRCTFRDQTLDGKHMTFFSRKMHGSTPESAAKTREIMSLTQSHTQPNSMLSVNQIQHYNATARLMQHHWSCRSCTWSQWSSSSSGTTWLTRQWHGQMHLSTSNTRWQAHDLLQLQYAWESSCACSKAHDIMPLTQPLKQTQTQQQTARRSNTTQQCHCKIDATTQMQIMHVITMFIIILRHNLTHLSVTWTDAPFEIKHSMASTWPSLAAICMGVIPRLQQKRETSCPLLNLTQKNTTTDCPPIKQFETHHQFMVNAKMSEMMFSRLNTIWNSDMHNATHQSATSKFAFFETKYSMACAWPPLAAQWMVVELNLEQNLWHHTPCTISNKTRKHTPKSKDNTNIATSKWMKTWWRWSLCGSMCL